MCVMSLLFLKVVVRLPSFIKNTNIDYHRQLITRFLCLFATMKKNLQIHKIDISSSLPLPYADEGVRAGFPSPAQDYLKEAIDLNKEIVQHPATTFMHGCPEILCVMKALKMAIFSL